VGSGGDCFWLDSGVRRSVLCWCVWQESGFSRREDVFTFNLLYKEMLKILCFESNLQRYCCSKFYYCSTQKASFLSPLTGHILR
jgi:hypothetical protein